VAARLRAEMAALEAAHANSFTDLRMELKKAHEMAVGELEVQVGALQAELASARLSARAPQPSSHNKQHHHGGSIMHGGGMGQDTPQRAPQTPLRGDARNGSSQSSLFSPEGGRRRGALFSPHTPLSTHPTAQRPATVDLRKEIEDERRM